MQFLFPPAIEHFSNFTYVVAVHTLAITHFKVYHNCNDAFIDKMYIIIFLLKNV